MYDNNSTKVVIGPVRLSYVNVIKPRPVNAGEEPRYSATLIIPKDNAEMINKIKVAINNAYNAATATFGGKLPPINTIKLPVRDGDAERPDDEAMKGCLFINTSSKLKPGVLKFAANGEKVPVTSEDDIYSGCYGYVSVNFFAYNRNGNKGISAGLNNVLVTEHGDYLGGRSSAESDFNDIQAPAASGPVVDGINW